MHLTPIMVSLSGISTYNDLLKTINRELIISSNNKKNIKMIYSLIEEISDFNFKGIKIGKAARKIMNNSIQFAINHDLVIFLDDFERANMNTEDLLKCVIQIQSRFNSKIFIISNEQKINNHDQSLYKIKEKVISYTFNFKGDNKKTALNIVKNRLNSKNIPKQYNDWIYNTINKMLNLIKNINLRIILDYLSCLKTIISHILNLKKSDKKFEFQLIKTACVSCFSFSYMIKLGHDELNGEFDKYFKNKTVMQIKTNRFMWKNEKNIPDGMSYLNDIFNNKIQCYDDNAVYFEEFYSFIKTGYFNEESYVSKMQDVFYGPNYNLIEKMEEYRLMNPEELDKIQNEVKNKYVDSHVYKTDFTYVNMMRNIYLLYSKFDEIDILSVSKNVLSDIKNKIKKILLSDDLYNDLDIYNPADTFYSDLISVIDDDKDIKNAIDEKKKRIKENASKELARNIIIEYSNYNHSQDIFYKFHLFKFLLDDYFIEKFKSDPKYLYYLECNFNFEFKEKGFNNKNNEYLNEITVFKDKVNDTIKSYDVNKIIIYNLKELSNSLNNAIIKINNNI